jgi:hypothetical protein
MNYINVPSWSLKNFGNFTNAINYPKQTLQFDMAWQNCHFFRHLSCFSKAIKRKNCLQRTIDCSLIDWKSEREIIFYTNCSSYWIWSPYDDSTIRATSGSHLLHGVSEYRNHQSCRLPSLDTAKIDTRSLYNTLGQFIRVCLSVRTLNYIGHRIVWRLIKKMVFSRVKKSNFKHMAFLAVTCSHT